MAPPIRRKGGSSPTGGPGPWCGPHPASNSKGRQSWAGPALSLSLSSCKTRLPPGSTAGRGGPAGQLGKGSAVPSGDGPQQAPGLTQTPSGPGHPEGQRDGGGQSSRQGSPGWRCHGRGWAWERPQGPGGRGAPSSGSPDTHQVREPCLLPSRVGLQNEADGQEQDCKLLAEPQIQVEPVGAESAQG